MNVKKLVLVLGVILLAGVLFFAGSAFAQSGWGNPEDQWPRPRGTWGHGPGHMYGWDAEDDTAPYGSMMHGWQRGDGVPSRGYGHMGGPMHGGDWTMAPGHMGGWGGLADVEPLSLDAAEEAVADYLAGLSEEKLAVGEIMIFDNHAYAQVVDEETGQGAFEVLVDPVTENVYPEPGPNMMWNTEYGHPEGGFGHPAGGFGMMHGWSQAEGDPDVTAEEAVLLAQDYLDEALPGAMADDHADPFPGYYTLHVLGEGGAIVGMLSVNAYSGDVFPHTWHGDFVEMADGHHE